jgi:tRNA (guanine-N1)-methyltransferase
MKAKPAIDAVESIIKKLKKTKSHPDKGGNEGGFAIILPSPAKDTFTQKTAHSLSNLKDIIFVCTRYEGIDYRFEEYMKKKYKKNFQKISL